MSWIADQLFWVINLRILPVGFLDIANFEINAMNSSQIKNPTGKMCKILFIKSSTDWPVQKEFWRNYEKWLVLTGRWNPAQWNLLEFSMASSWSNPVHHDYIVTQNVGRVAELPHIHSFSFCIVVCCTVFGSEERIDCFLQLASPVFSNSLSMQTDFRGDWSFVNSPPTLLLCTHTTSHHATEQWFPTWYK